MKKTIACLIFVIVTLFAYAQKDVTQFLGIPVDGTKSEMIKKIKKKGFKKVKFANKTMLSGRFNDRDVYVDVATNSDNKVYRVTVFEIRLSESVARIHYNNLCYQFKNNPKYYSQKDGAIPDDEDMSYEIKVRGKDYQAVFFQAPTEIGDSIIHNQTLGELTLKMAGEWSNLSEEEQHKQIKDTYLEKMSELISNKRVWFTIIPWPENDEYGIAIYYENVYNCNNGKDL